MKDPENVPAPKGTKSKANPKAKAKGGLRVQLSQAEARLKRAEMLLEISQRMAACSSTQESLETFLEIIVAETRADRGTLFLNDEHTGELYSRVLVGNFHREIRIINNVGIAGWVFTRGRSALVSNAYDDERFDCSVDEKTGYKTENILCVPIQTVKNEVIGVAQAINKTGGMFDLEDQHYLETMANQAALALKTMQAMERMQQKRDEENQFLDIVADITSEIKLTHLLKKVMSEATRLLDADRGTLFLNDERANELYTEVGQGLEVKQIRFPNHVGIAGTVFSSARTVNIPYAYADLRFNPSFDKQTGYFTRSILCVPLVNKQGRVIGVTQMLNKRGGAFTDEDEGRLKAFTAQISIALENAKLFDDVQSMKNYNESMLESMSNGVLTMDVDGKIVTCNLGGAKILKIRRAEDILNQQCSDVFVGENSWMVERVKKVRESNRPETIVDAEIQCDKERVSINININPLLNSEGKSLGTMLVMEDISSEKRIKSTMSRYMNPQLAEQMLAGGEDVLGGKSVKATILFSDIRSFTSITEQLGAAGTVSMLNEYFTDMVEAIQGEGGMLDKFIGDAIMAGFGVPVSYEDDEDRAMRAAINMFKRLAALNKVRQLRGEAPIEMGVGLNTDMVISGNIGSPKRMDYTMIGDGVNLAARLESACKTYSAQILISEYTYASLKGTYRMREVDKVIVKGKSEPVSIYEVLDFHTEETFPNLMEVVSQFNSGIEHYRKGEWGKATSAFEKALANNRNDKVSQMYIDRCETLKNQDLGDDWNGVWVMKTK
ncbi:MAG: GAF domain-containing protein [Deltaproteobacteria bacterium]|jgi:adenylate cyclase|nr:GAF domain-containing protein [Deltaproteobacteria bacterium]MBT6432959.1 GAF domain-containing protein [Deltaproteobacteria bacterium]MBT6489613.1 GAF domain-containing protein [Deltaproteobacteria bacterium]